MENLAEINPNLILPFPYNTTYGLGKNNSTEVSDASSVSESSQAESVVESDKSTMTIPEDASFEDFSLNFLLESENSDIGENPEQIVETSDHEFSEQFEKVMNYINNDDDSVVSGDSDLNVEFENNGKQKLEAFSDDTASTDFTKDAGEILQALSDSNSSENGFVQQSISELENEFDKLQADNNSDVSDSYQTIHKLFLATAKKIIQMYIQQKRFPITTKKKIIFTTFSLQYQRMKWVQQTTRMPKTKWQR